MSAPNRNRNELVEQAVNHALARIDAFIAGETITLPSREYRGAIERLLTEQKPSIRTAVLFLMFYRLADQGWDLSSVPTGSRGKFGDKRLSEELSKRSLTLHSNIKAWGENLGSKGNVREFKFGTDPRFMGFLANVRDANPDEQQKIADFMAQRFAESQRIPTPLPPVADDLLTFARAKSLFLDLLSIRSEARLWPFDAMPSGVAPGKTIGGWSFRISGACADRQEPRRRSRRQARVAGRSNNPRLAAGARTAKVE